MGAGSSAPKSTGQNDFSKTADDVTDLAAAQRELARYATMMPSFQEGLLLQAKGAIARIRRETADDAAGAGGMQAADEKMLADASKLSSECEQKVIDDESPDVDKKAKEVWGLQDDLKKAVKSKNYQEAAKLQEKLKEKQGPRYYPKQEDLDRLKNAEKMKDKLKNYIARTQSEISAHTAMQEWTKAAALKSNLERAEKARHPLLQYCSRFRINKVKEGGTIGSMSYSKAQRTRELAKAPPGAPQE